MSLVKKSAVAMALAGAVSAQSTSSVVNIFFPDIDNQALIGSVIASDASQTTLVVACPSSVSDTDCGLATPVTVTAGPSTFHVSIDETFDDITVVLDCAVDGTTAATCAQTFVGPEFYLETDLSILTATDISTSNTAITTSISSTVLAQSEISFISITLVDSLDTADAATTGATGTASTASSTASGTRTSNGSSTASQTSGSSTGSGAATATGSGNSGASRTDSRALAYSVFGAGLLGLTAFLL